MERLPAYCQSNDSKFELLKDTAVSFIEALDLPRVHPRCLGNSAEETPIPDDNMHPSFFYEKEMSFLSQVITFGCQAAPALLALAELWIRLFACVIAPLICSYIALSEFPHFGFGNKKNQDGRGDLRQVVFMILGLVTSIILFTDTLYVQAYGRRNGALHLGVMVFLSLRSSGRLIMYRKRFLCSLATLLSVALFLYVNSEKGASSPYDHPGIDIATIKGGLYYSSRSQFISRVVELWPEHERSYTKDNASPLPTGDSMTGIPFLLNSSPAQDYVRLWVPSMVDDEAVAIDISFPPDGIHSFSKPIYLILHGLNGGSDEEYVREFVGRRTKEGCTCIVMVARGMMDTPVFGWNVFHGARVSDVDASAKAIRKGLGPNQIVAGVGYSMGAIIISNYVARSGGECGLDAAVAVSGGLDMRENLNFMRSMRLWQPMLAQSLKEDFIINKFDGRFRQRLTKEQHLALMRASSVSQIDVHAIVTYNKFDNLMHYYAEMSAMGDTNAFQSVPNNVSTYPDVGRIANVSIPLCVIHALDDPITSWRTMGHNPDLLVNTGDGNIVMLLTDSGGHVGWPLGINIASSGWKFMNNAASGFINSVNRARME